VGPADALENGGAEEELGALLGFAPGDALLDGEGPERAFDLLALGEEGVQAGALGRGG